VARSPRGDAVATFTDGARTALLSGGERTFSEATTRATVTIRYRVRLMPQPWQPAAAEQAWFHGWLAQMLSSREPDLLDIAGQYQQRAPDLRDASGLRIAGDAAYGPLVNGVRREGSDFNDYLGIDWRYPNGSARRARPANLGAMDCSGFVRMVYGYRSGYPLEYDEMTGKALPRRAVMMAGGGPGVVVLPDTGRQATDLAPLQPGDLLFFDADPNDGPQTDHVGVYLGVDSDGRARFISSRKTANGPTMGDLSGASVLTGTGLYARSFRSAKRL
jgi:hypothetical protein